jgi:hypothetical protein
MPRRTCFIEFPRLFWSVWSVSSVWLNQTNRIDQIDGIDQTNQRDLKRRRGYHSPVYEVKKVMGGREGWVGDDEPS